MTFNDLINSANLQYLTGTEISSTTILVFMGYSIMLSIYLYFIYRVSTRSSFYSPVFAKTLIGMGIITTGIILAMQSSLVVSLGMVGALSIVRFRNAVKSPLDLLFLFWSISNGIICGTGYVEIAIVVSAVMSILILAFDLIPHGNSSYIVTVYGDDTLDENALLQNIKPYGKNIKVRTRSLYDTEQELLLELHTTRGKELIAACKESAGVTGASLIYHDGEVRF